MNKNHIFGTSCGFLSGILWGLDTVLTGIVLSMSPFIDGSEAITIAPIVSALLHDTFSSILMMIYFFKRRTSKNNKINKNKKWQVYMYRSYIWWACRYGSLSSSN